MNDSLDSHSPEQRILRIMRKVLGNVVKDTAPRPGQPGALSQSTIDDIRLCFELIALREKELAGLDSPARPLYPGDRPSAQPLRFATRKNQND